MRPTWDEFFMGLALTVSKRSVDPRTQVGAVVVDRDRIIIGLGYNGFPRGCDDEALPLEAPDKYDYIAHAEANALANCSVRPRGCCLYATLETCNTCAMLIINNQIAEVVYLIEREHPAARLMFRQAGVKLRRFEGSLEHLKSPPLIGGEPIVFSTLPVKMVFPACWDSE